MAERFSCTDNDATYYKGMVAQAKIVRYLRDEYALLGFAPKNPRGYALTLSPAGDFGIAVAAGDEATGYKDRNPRTKSDKGPATQDAVAINRDQLFLFEMPRTSLRPVPQPDAKARTWVLLFHIDFIRREVRCELSYPAGMDEDGFIVEWEERIILTAISFDDCRIETSPDSPKEVSGFGQEINVRVEKRN